MLDFFRENTPLFYVGENTWLLVVWALGKWEGPYKDLQWVLSSVPFLTLLLAVSLPEASQELCLASWHPLQFCLLLMFSKPLLPPQFE